MQEVNFAPKVVAFSETKKSSPACSCPKALKVALRVFSSPLFWAGVQVVGIAVFAAVVWSGQIFLPINIALMVVGGGVILFSIYLAVFRKQLIYESSLIGTMAKVGPNKKKQWSNLIIEHLHLGMIPLKNKNQIKKLFQELNVKHVITYLEPFELKNGMASEPVQPVEWKKVGITHHWIKAKDFKPLSQDEIGEGVKQIHQGVSNKETVYVHCKAGVGRSATAVICYLFQYHRDMVSTFDKAYNFVKDKRPQVRLNAKQKAAAIAYCEWVSQQQPPTKLI